MRAVEFTTELGNKPVVTIRREVAAKLPKSGRERIIVLTPDDPENAQWRAGTYEQFVSEDSPEVAVYDSYWRRPRVFGEIFICRFPFTSGAFRNAASCPRLVRFAVGRADCRITSATRSEPLDVPISDLGASRTS